MWTEVPDIAHSDFHVAYKYFKRQKIAKVPKITELERVLYKQKNECLFKKTVKFIYFDCVFSIRVYYRSLKQETSTKYRVHVHKRAVERHCYLEPFHRKCTKQPEMTSWVASYETFNFKNIENETVSEKVTCKR